MWHPVVPELCLGGDGLGFGFHPELAYAYQDDQQDGA